MKGRLLTLAPSATTQRPRECGDCRLCCKVLAVQALEKPRGAWCTHACKKGCGIYEMRPEQCRTFSCLWLLAGSADLLERGEDQAAGWQRLLPEAERPDRLRCVFTPIMGGVRDPRDGRMHRAIACAEGDAGAADHARMRTAIQRLLRDGFAVVRNRSDRPLGVWFPDGAWLAFAAGTADGRYHDETTATPEENARIEREAEAALEEADGRPPGSVRGIIARHVKRDEEA